MISMTYFRKLMRHCSEPHHHKAPKGLPECYFKQLYSHRSQRNHRAQFLCICTVFQNRVKRNPEEFFIILQIFLKNIFFFYRLFRINSPHFPPRQPFSLSSKIIIFKTFHRYNRQNFPENQKGRYFFIKETATTS